MEKIDLQKKSEEIRQKVIQYHKKTGKGHIGSALSSIEILTTLYYDVMNEKDSFLLSKGHGSSALYMVLNDKGLIPDKDLSGLEIHPKLNDKYRIEASTGSLGHGLSIGLGMALADRKNKVYALLGDGECNEGQVWEAARVASELAINNLVAIVDCNGFQGFKETRYSDLDIKFSAFGWEYAWCGGHDCKELSNILKGNYNLPLVVLAETVKGLGIKEEGTLKSHYAKVK